MNKKKYLAFFSAVLLLLTAGCTDAVTESEKSESVVQENSQAKTEATQTSTEAPADYDYTTMTAAEITATLTLDEKICQMLIPAIYEIEERDMRTTNYGSILSVQGGGSPVAASWRYTIDQLQDNALRANAPIPFLYGQDSVHGVNYAADSVIFPHNINIGAANNSELTYQMGLAVADEMKLTKMIWNYAPCVAVASDPRWGRTYESYSSDPALVQSLSDAFSRGQLDGGVIICAKHFIGDGSVTFGTGEVSEGFDRLIDRGNAELTEAEIDEQLAIYKNLIDNGAQTIMISHSALNGVKMHENTEYIIDVLRGELGFEGVVVSDWNSIQNIESTKDYKEQLIISVNAGIDWLMEPSTFEDASVYLAEAVEEGSIPEERIDEAVTRIIQLKLDAGLFEDPYLENISTEQEDMGSEEYRKLARQLVAQSQVLLKNEGDLLPLESGTKVFVTGPAANDTGVQCGGWTMMWQGRTDADNGGKKNVKGATTILEALEAVAAEYDLEIITDEASADEADVTLLCIGEIPYAEWYGDAESLSVTDGEMALEGNAEAIELAQSLGKPTVTLLVAGRNLVIEEYRGEWDSIVMCGLFGSEGQGVADVLVGAEPFTGTLSMPWYASEEDITSGKVLYDIGYGLQADGETDTAADPETAEPSETAIFYVQDGVFRMDTSLFGKSYAQLNALFDESLTAPEEFPYWADDLTLTDAEIDGLPIALVFQNEKLVMAAYDQKMNFSQDVVAAAEDLFGTAIQNAAKDYSWNLSEGGQLDMYENVYAETGECYFSQRYESADMKW